MNIYKKTKNGGPVKTDKDFYPRNGPKRFELHLFRAFDVFKHGHFVPNHVCISFFSYSRFAVRHTEKYIIITDMY